MNSGRDVLSAMYWVIRPGLTKYLPSFIPYVRVISSVRRRRKTGHVEVDLAPSHLEVARLSVDVLVEDHLVPIAADGHRRSTDCVLMRIGFVPENAAT